MAPSPLSPNAILRGIQLALLGAYRALQNPTFVTGAYIRLAAISVVSGILLSLIFSIPIYLIRAIIWSTASNEVYLAREKWFVGAVKFLENQVLQVPMVVMGLMQHVGGIADDLFMKSVQFADEQYLKNHKNEDPRSLRPLYYPTLSQYTPGQFAGPKAPKPRKTERVEAYTKRTFRRLLTQLAVYFSSFTPYIGPYLPPAYTLYLLYPSVGPAAMLLTPILFLPRQYSTMLLGIYLSSRALTRELLEPYFRRLPFTTAQKAKWFRDRESVLLGVGLTWTVFMRNSGWLRVLLMAAATAGMGVVITKVTGPPVEPAKGKEEIQGWCEKETEWRNRNLFFKPVRFLKDLEEIAGEEIKKLERRKSEEKK